MGELEVKVEDFFILDNLHKSHLVKQKGFLVTINIQETFDFAGHIFLFHVLGKYEFGKNFIRWLEFLVKNQE